MSSAPQDAASSSRLERLAGRTAAFGGRTALLLVAIGLLVIGFGYLGASDAHVGREVLVQAQLPYLLSGGFLGLAIVVIGAAVLVAQSTRADSVRLEARLAQLVDTATAPAGLRGASGPRTGAAFDAATTGEIPSNLAGLVAVGAASYHTPTCRLVQGRDDVLYRTPAEARAQRLKPCRVCQPDSVPVTVRAR